MKKIPIVILASILVVQGCTTTLSGQGAAIRILEDKERYNCEYIEEVTGRNSPSSDADDNLEGAMNDVRNRAAAVGANAIHILNSHELHKKDAVVFAEAMKCQFD